MLTILHQSIWRDEAFSLLLAEKNFTQIISLSLRDSSPPLYYLLLHYWLLFLGDSPEVGRLLSFLFHVLCLPVAYFLTQRLTRSRAWSVLTGLLIFSNPFLFQYAFEIRNYSLFSFLVLASFYFFLVKKSFLFSVFLSLTLLTHNFAIFSLAAFLIAWAAIEKSVPENLKARIFSFAGYFSLPLITLASWTPIAVSQYQKVTEGFWIKRFQPSDLFDLLRQFGGGGLNYSQKEAVLILGAFLALLLILFSLVKSARSAWPETILFTTAILVPLVLVLTISILRTPIYHPRYLIDLVPLMIVFFLWTACRLVQSDPRFTKPIGFILAFYLLTILVAAGTILSRATKPPTKEAVQRILTQIKPGEIIMSESNLNFLEVKYYLRRSGKSIPIYTYSPDGQVVFYIGGALFEKGEILKQIPTDKAIWQVGIDGRVQRLVKGRSR